MDFLKTPWNCYSVISQIISKETNLINFSFWPSLLQRVPQGFVICLSLRSILRLHETHNALQLPLFFFFSFFCHLYPGLRNCKLVFLILKISVDRGGEVQLFPRYPCKNWYKNWYLHFYKTYDHQICQAGTSIGFDSNETNQAGAGDVITSRSRDKLKHLLNQSVYGHQTWQDGNLVDGPLPIKSHDPLVMWSCEIMWQTEIIISP